MSNAARRAESSPLIARLITDLGYPEIDLEGHDAFVARPGMNVLFFPGDPATVRDATDVAVVLPELVAEFQGRLSPGVVTDVHGDGLVLMRRYGFTKYPALVFVRSGGYVGAYSGIRDWAEYLEGIATLFEAEPRRPPGFSIPVISA